MLAIDPSLKEVFFRGGKERYIMKGKVLAFITAILFGATMVAAPLVQAAQGSTGSAAMETAKPKKTKKAKKSTTKKAKKEKKDTAKATKKPGKKKAKTGETKA